MPPPADDRDAAAGAERVRDLVHALAGATGAVLLELQLLQDDVPAPVAEQLRSTEGEARRACALVTALRDLLEAQTPDTTTPPDGPAA